MPATISHFNIRVYGICLRKHCLLLSKESYKQHHFIKFPGGGLKLGEGLKDCLQREWKEELQLSIEVGEHFYTTDFFQKSAFDNSQVIAVYYWVHIPGGQEPVNTNSNEALYWLPVTELDASVFPLPIDKVVGGKLKDYFNSQL